jgi:membrane protein HdeD
MKHWYLLLAAGAIAIVGGVAALLNPLAATLTATVLAGWMFVIVGVVLLATLFSEMGWGRRLWTILLGALAVWLGLNILGNPLEGAMTLTLIVGISFLAEGVVKLILAWGTRGTPYFWMVLLSGAISVLLGGMILANFPQSAATILGILLAVDLISTGISMVALSLHARDNPGRA